MSAALERIIERFPFEEVLAHMVEHDWHWRGSPAPPTISELKACVRQNYDGCMVGGSSMSGGFRIAIVLWEEDVYEITVQFMGIPPVGKRWRPVWTEQEESTAVDAGRTESTG